MQSKIRPFAIPYLRVGLQAAVVFAALAATVQTISAQAKASRFDRQRNQEILSMVKSDVMKNYYDANYHGVDLNARFKQAEEMLKQAETNGQMYGIIASVLIELNDSHTLFIPPSRVSRTEYGWQMQAIGDKCYVTAVKPRSDAEAKGLRPGDLVVSVDGMIPTRDELWKIQYLYYSLRPRGGMRVIVQKPNGEEKQLDILAKVTDGKQVTDLTDYTEYMRYLLEGEKAERLSRNRFVENEENVVIWKMAGFNLYDEDEVDRIMQKVKKFKALVLDLRGNGGGYVVMLERMLGHFFDHNVKIADLKGRKELKPSIAKTRGNNYFKGQVIVLIDSASGSAAEVFSRLMQIEKRATIIGDHSSGKVMQSIVFPRTVGVDTVAFFGTNITQADLIMTDGKRLEHAGVVPDELILPTADDLANGRDPVLARATELAGFKLDSVKAGALFPIEWRK